MIADVVGSTAIGEQLGPERSKLLIDEVMRLLAEHVRRYEGTVAQLVGDEMLAFFGAPVSHEDDSERAVRAALAIQRAVQAYAEEVKDAYGIDLAVRIGINTGPVVAGVIGQTKFSYDVWGETVNTAWHMETYGAPGHIQVNETTYARLRDKYLFEDRGEFFVKDKGELRTYFLKGRKQIPAVMRQGS